MKRKSLTIVLSLLLVAAIAIAAPNGKGYKQNNDGPRKAQRECLLTDDERDAVQDAKRDYEKVVIPMRADVKVLMMDIQDMVTAGKSAKEIAPKLDKLNALKADMASERLDHQIEVRKIVGEEKYEKMGMARKHMAQGRKGKAGKHGGHFKGQGRGFDGGCGPRFDGEGPYGK